MVPYKRYVKQKILAFHLSITVVVSSWSIHSNWDGSHIHGMQTAMPCKCYSMPLLLLHGHSPQTFNPSSLSWSWTYHISHTYWNKGTGFSVLLNTAHTKWHVWFPWMDTHDSSTIQWLLCRWISNLGVVCGQPDRRVAWVEPLPTSKLIDYLHSNIKEDSVQKACWADMPKYAGENTGLLYGGKLSREKTFVGRYKESISGRKFWTDHIKRCSMPKILWRKF